MTDLQALLEADLAEAERKAWDALARWKFWMFGYHAADVIKIKRRLGRGANRSSRSAIGIVMLIASYAAAAEITGPRWQLWEQPPGQDWRPRGKQLGTSTACDLDAASLAMVVEKATRIACRKVTP